MSFNSLNVEFKNLLKKLKIHNNHDLINYFPKKYEDRREVKNIHDTLKYDKIYPIKAKIINYKSQSFGQVKLLKIKILNKDTIAYLLSYNSTSLKNTLIVGDEYIIYADFYYKHNEIQASKFELVNIKEKDPLNMLRITPIYKLTKGITQTHLRNIIYATLTSYYKEKDNLSETIIKKRELLDINTAYYNMHFPKNKELLIKSFKRFRYSEAFEIIKKLKDIKDKTNNIIKPHQYKNKDNKVIKSILNKLPFKLTNDQKKVFEEIKKDIYSTRPMNRLLQGDVGSGKTIIGILTMLLAYENDKQAILISPRDVLARQHYDFISNLLYKTPIHIVLLTSQITASKREEINSLIKQGFYKLIIGTHSVFSEKIEYNNLSVIVIDEQHKFGTNQRLKLIKKAKHPDILLMSATPIPQTLSLILYGNLDISILKDKPYEKNQIESHCVNGRENRLMMYQFIKQEIIQNDIQCFVVCPLIDHKENKNILNAKSTVDTYNELKELLNIPIGLLHSKLTLEDQTTVLENFTKKEYKILVSTNIIEVGISIKNSNIIVIENANYFGLSQLHQMRGRVGRGGDKGYCFFCINEIDINEKAKDRIISIINNNDGFDIASKDLKIRGPGDFIGNKQSGIEYLKMLNLNRDKKIIIEAQEDINL